MRYTLDITRPHALREGLFLVLDKGRETQAYASENATFLNECHVRAGIFYGGIFYGGVFRGGTFYGGVFRDGRFYDGVFNHGVFNNGLFYNGVFDDGVFQGGTFYGGTFRGGGFHGGEFQHGWLPLQIQGSRHFVNIPDGIHIRIGCIKKTPEEWACQFKEIGESEGYSEAEIAEYKQYIDVATSMISSVSITENN